MLKMDDAKKVGGAAKPPLTAANWNKSASAAEPCSEAEDLSSLSRGDQVSSDDDDESDEEEDEIGDHEESRGATTTLTASSCSGAGGPVPAVVSKPEARPGSIALSPEQLVAVREMLQHDIREEGRKIREECRFAQMVCCVSAALNANHSQAAPDGRR